MPARSSCSCTSASCRSPPLRARSSATPAPTACCTASAARATSRSSSTSTWCLWGVAKDGKQWDILISEAPLLAGLVKAYIRHDLFVQRIFADFPAELEERYGSGLLELASLSATVGPAADEMLEGAG